jgi:hypothetical protein
MGNCDKKDGQDQAIPSVGRGPVKAEQGVASFTNKLAMSGSRFFGGVLKA